MRWSVVAVFTLLVPLAGFASAQTDTPLVEDARGDVKGQGAAAGVPSPAADVVDLVSLRVTEDPQGFRLHLEVASLAPSGQTGELNSVYLVEFKNGDTTFAAEVRRYAFASTAAQYDGRLLTYDAGTARYNAITGTEVTVEGNVMESFLPRVLLRDGSGQVPSPGGALHDFVAVSASNSIGSVCVGECMESIAWTDRMPDRGVGDKVHDVIYGVVQTGHALLASLEPFRASNGEATTFVFQVDAANQGDDEDVFRLNATRAPASWDIQVPAQTIKIPAHSNATVPVVVRTPFAHSHGGAASFLLEMRSMRDPGAVGRLEMGVFYPSPPQPAGHHDTLWLHTVDWSGDATTVALAAALGMLGAQGMLETEYMNTLEEDENAHDVPSEGQYCRILALDPDYPVGSGYCWEFPLEPGLLMGLDFDLSRTGTLELVVESQLPLPGASVEGELMHYGQVTGDYPPGYPIAFMQREVTTVATLNRTAMQDIGALGEASFTLDVVPTPEADRIPYQKGAALVLELRVNTLRPENFYLGPKTPPPALHAGARLQLPLLEYEDAVQQVVEFGSGVALDPMTDQQRRVNPGKTVVFKAAVRNDGSDETTFRIGLVGSHLEWSRLLGPTSVRLAPGTQHDVAIAVAAPADAAGGDRADLVLEAASQQSIEDRALLRFVAIVETAEDLPDERDLADGLSASPSKKSPGLPVLLMLGAILLLARRR